MITLKHIKLAKFASQETHCYNAVIYFNGRRVCGVANAGHGGCDDYWNINPTVMADVNAYIETLPEVTVSNSESYSYTYKPTLETICSGLVNDWVMMRDLKRHLRQRIVWVEDGKCWNSQVLAKSASYLTLLKARAQKHQEMHLNAKVLNLLPFNEALELYKENV